MISHKQRRGFTLVELLVVIVIIGVLVALLLPSFRSAREKAKLVKCISSLRQQTIAAYAFASDNNGWLPYTQNLGAANNDLQYNLWPFYLYVNSAAINNVQNLGFLYNRGYITKPEVLFCPATMTLAANSPFPNLLAGPTGMLAIRGDYFWNPEINSVSDSNRKFSNINAGTKERLVLNYCFGRAHGQSVYPVAFTDGSVQVVRSSQADVYAATANGASTDYSSKIAFLNCLKQ